MPIYEYQCVDCAEKSEAIQRLDEPRLTICEECGGALRRLQSAPAFQFKGSGWYVTDYAGKGRPEKSEKGAASEAAGEGGDKAASGDGGGTAAPSDAAKSAGSQRSDSSKSADSGAKSTD